MGENIYIVIDIVKQVHLPASRNELARMYVILNNDAVAIHQEVSATDLLLVPLAAVHFGASVPYTF